MINKDVNKAMEYAKASQAMEGLTVSEKQEKLILERVNGKISEEEFYKRARKLASE
ncbi:antitoxin VbhA family protein [Cytobacillus horneckiae]|uniref:antitoxin VbhA family protein n=1 Tax=Cytobacillus horneckiae TaxID=549687 RepID=UPI003D21CA18